MSDGRTVWQTDSCAGAAADSAGAGGFAILSDRPTVRRSDRFGGNRMPGSTSTMSIRMKARMTRRSTGPLGHGIVAAGVQRVAAEDAFQTEPGSPERAVAFHRLQRVPRARRCEPTLREHEM